MKRAQRHDHAALPATDAVVDKFRTKETAAGVFSSPATSTGRPARPARPIQPLRPDPPVAPVPARAPTPPPASTSAWPVNTPVDADPPPVSIRPLRAPAPTVTTIRVAPEPVDDFEFETATPWLHDPNPDPQPSGRKPTVIVRPDNGQRILSWLDEDEL